MMFGTGILQGANILSYIVLARLLSQADFGTYRQLFLINQLLWAISFSAFPASLLFFAGRALGDAEKAAIVRQHLYIVSGLGFLVFLTLLVSGPLIGLMLNNPEIVQLMPIFAVFPAAYMLSSLLGPSLIAKGATHLLPRLTGGLALINSIPVLLVAWMGGALQQIVGATALASIASAAVCLGIILYKTSTAHRLKSVNLRPILGYSFPLLATAALGLLGLRLDQIAVSHFFGPAVFAIYAVGAFELPIYSLVKSSSASVLLPELSQAVREQNWSRVLSIWQDMQWKNAAMIMPVSAGLFVYSHEFVEVLFGHEYSEAAPIFAVFTLLGPVRATTFNLVLRAMGRTRTELAGTSLFVMLAAALIYMFAPLYGIVAAALAVIGALCAYCILLLLLTVSASDNALRVLQLLPPWLPLTYGILLILFAGLRFGTVQFDVVPVVALGLCISATIAISFLLLRQEQSLFALMGIRHSSKEISL